MKKFFYFMCLLISIAICKNGSLSTIITVSSILLAILIVLIVIGDAVVINHKDTIYRRKFSFFSWVAIGEYDITIQEWGFDKKSEETDLYFINERRVYIKYPTFVPIQIKGLETSALLVRYETKCGPVVKILKDKKGRKKLFIYYD